MKAADRHASIEDLISLERRELSATEEQELRDHLAHCGRCEAERSLAADFAHDSGEPLEEGQSDRVRERISEELREKRAARRVRPGNPWLRRSLLAAAVVFAAIGIYQFRPEQIEKAPGGVLRSTHPDAPLQLRAQVTAEGWLLEWEAEEGSTACKLIVQSMRGEVLWSREVAAGPVEISSEEISGSEAAAPWFASVRCTVGDRQIESNLVTLDDD